MSILTQGMRSGCSLTPFSLRLTSVIRGLKDLQVVLIEGVSINSCNFGVPVEESDSGSTWLHPPSYEIEGLCVASVGIPLANFTMGSGTGSPKQPEAHWEEGENVQAEMLYKV